MKFHSIGVGACAVALFSAAGFALLAPAAGAADALFLVGLADLLAILFVAARRMWRKPAQAAFLKYMLIGAATTLVNYASYWLIAHPLREAFGVAPNHSLWIALATTVSWLAAVVFSFFPNKAYAFGSHDWSRATVLREGRTFFLSRGMTFGFDLLFMLVAVSLGMHDMLAKILSNIVVVIGNFFTSKLIFRKR